MSIDLAPHHQQLSDEGYTIVENAIEPELITSTGSKPNSTGDQPTTDSRETGPPGPTTCWRTARSGKRSRRTR